MPAGQLFVDCDRCMLRIHATIEHDTEASFLDAATAALRAFQKHRQTHSGPDLEEASSFDASDIPPADDKSKPPKG
jgi:hypothetical protein